MKIVSLIPPSHFPTILPDPGPWWNHIASLHTHELLQFNANYAWWRALCSPHIKKALLTPLSFTQRLRQRVEWSANEFNLDEWASLANHSLDRLCTDQAYQSVSDYVRAVSPLAEWLAALSTAQGELEFSVDFGVRVKELDYSCSHDLVSYAQRQTILSSLLASALEEFPLDVGLLVVAITAPGDLLTAMIAIHQLRKDRPTMHVCLADHGYENFSLSPHVARLQASGALERIFDSIIVSKDERTALLYWLIHALERGDSSKGFLTLNALPAATFLPPSLQYLPPPPASSFSPRPIFWTRLSERRCYWSRCTFCVQNNKYDDPRPPSRSEIGPALDRIEALIKIGYRTFIFSDEALSPALLVQFCQGIQERGLSFEWACRCKLELSHTADLFQRMRLAGCYEVLFGLESISPHVQRLMDKHVSGLDVERIAQIFQSVTDAGIGLHVNLIAGFPGDSVREASESVDFAIEALAAAESATFYLNQFGLFPDTPIYNNPGAFGVIPHPVKGDMPVMIDYEVVPEMQQEAHAIEQMIPALRAKLVSSLGWSRLGTGYGPKAAFSLYSLSGHGALFKTQRPNPFSSLLREGSHFVYA